jgi:DNA mismatch repair protein MutL
MGRIKILNPEVRDRIAAGEVITRPVSVVKELLENSLDAMARRIELEIEEGGKRKCLVNDDGMGMNRDDARLALERYATSKISRVEDIEVISSYGFRGEALASIAQVARFELETSDGREGTKIEVIGGVTKGEYDSHRPQGTKIKITDLFFNLPVRRKFLKSAVWERRLIIEAVKSYALIAPQTAFSLSEVDHRLLDIPSTEDNKRRIQMLFPRDLCDNLIAIEHEIGGVKIKGFVSRPDFPAAHHHLNYIYVNSRPVKYPRFYRAIISAYQNPKDNPAFWVNIIVDPRLVDVNIHPTKSEVRLKDERYIVDILTQLIKNTVFSRIRTDDFRPTRVDFGSSPTTQGVTDNTNIFVQEMTLPYAREEKKFPSADSDEFWQLHNTYILAQTKSGFIMIDQHVAHERIIYESIMKGKHEAQRLLFPISLELSAEEYRAYKTTRTLLRELGVEFKEFSSQTIVIDSLPAYAHIDRAAIAELFKEIDGLGNLIKQKSEVAKVLACRTAIKAGQKLTHIEMQDLIDKLFACENPYTCPHGRPIILKFSLEDLGARFGRE